MTPREWVRSDNPAELLHDGPDGVRTSRVFYRFTRSGGALDADFPEPAGPVVGVRVVDAANGSAVHTVHEPPAGVSWP